jgi:hypothetical protein
MIETMAVIILALSIIPATNYAFRLVIWLLVDEPNQFEEQTEDN